MTTKLATKPEILSSASPHFRYTPEGLLVEGKPSYQQCEHELGILKRINRLAQFWIGDLLNYMEAEYGESYSQALDAFDYSLGSLANMKSVSREFDSSRRREHIPFSYYAALQSLEPAQQEELLDKVEAGEITALSHLRNRAKIIKEHSNRSKAGCEHNTIVICQLCGEVMYE